MLFHMPLKRNLPSIFFFVILKCWSEVYARISYVSIFGENYTMGFFVSNELRLPFPWSLKPKIMEENKRIYQNCLFLVLMKRICWLLISTSMKDNYCKTWLCSLFLIPFPLVFSWKLPGTGVVALLLCCFATLSCRWSNIAWVIKRCFRLPSVMPKIV